MNMKESVMEVIDVFKSGGPVMYALLLCSICTAVIMIERGMFYHRAGKNLGIFVDNLPDMLLNKSWNDAYADAAQEDNAAAFVAQEGIRAAAEGKDLRLALDTAYSTAAAELRAHLNYLSMIVTLSPLLGLLGTIAGMISSPDFQFAGGPADGYHRGDRRSAYRNGSRSLRRHFRAYCPYRFCAKDG